MFATGCPIGARVVAREFDAGRRTVRSAIYVDAPPGVTVSVGRKDADLDLGVDPLDLGVSAAALRLTATSHGWDIQITNRNGGWLYPWGRAAKWVPAQKRLTLSAPRLAVLLRGEESKSRDHVEHWVLIENDAYAPTTDQPRSEAGSDPFTTKVVRPPSLTDGQEQAVEVVFGEFLAWPPMSAPRVCELAEAASVIGGIGANAVGERLNEVRRRLSRVGPYADCERRDPELVRALVDLGCLAVPHYHVFADPR